MADNRNEEGNEFEQMAEEYLDSLQTPVGEDQEDGSGLPSDGDDSEEGGEAGAADESALEGDREGQPEGDDHEGDEEEESTLVESTFTLPDTDLYGELRGQKVTTQQLVESGILNRLLTRDHQEMHHTTLYQDLKERYKQLESRLEEIAKPPEEQPTGPDVDPATASAAVQAHYYPALAEAAKSGVFESDFLEAYPQVATQLEHRFAMGANALVKLGEEIGKIQEHLTGYTQRVDTQESSSFLSQQVNALAESDERLFGRLGDADHQREFLAWTIDENNPLPYKDMDVSQITPEVLASAYVSYLHATRQTGGKKKAAASSTPRRKRPNMATDGGGSTARDQGGKGGQNEFDALKQELEEVEEQRLQGI